VSAAHIAFVNAMAIGVRVAAAAALVSAVAAVFALPRQGKPTVVVAPQPTETQPATTAALVPAV